VAIPDSPYENQRFLLLRQFRDLPNALVSGSVLNSASIDFFLADENTIRMDWFWSNLLGGIKLCVRESDADAASDLLDLDIPENFDFAGVGEYEQPRCPNCQSLEVFFQGLNKPTDYSRVLLGASLPLSRSLWQCDSCGHQWPESNEKPPADFLMSASSILLIVIALETFAGVLFSVIAAIRSVALHW